MTTEKSEMKEIGLRIRALREKRGLEIEQVAQMLNMSRVNYNRKELGGVVVTAPEILQIGRILDAPAAYFYGQMDEEQFEDADSIRFYNGLPPVMKQVAKSQLKALFDAQDKEAKELEPVTHGKKAN